ncbi:MAG: hypothetical protein U5K71_15510 [Gracilimonas sp.]|nr:hypothetical protein [Gracilimonas sp.]
MNNILNTLFIGFLLICFSSLPEKIYAQKSDSVSHSYYFELGGAGFLYSLNYEYGFKKNLAFRLGTMFLRYKNFENEGDENQYQGIIIPITINKFVGKKAHKLEFGTGFVIQDFRVENNLPNRDEMFLGMLETDTGGIGILGTFGYRYQPVNGNFLFRLGISLDASPSLNYKLGGGLGLSLGFVL